MVVDNNIRLNIMEALRHNNDLHEVDKMIEHILSMNLSPELKSEITKFVDNNKSTMVADRLKRNLTTIMSNLTNKKLLNRLKEINSIHDTLS